MSEKLWRYFPDHILTNVYPGGYIINTVSNPDLVLKHITHKLHQLQFDEFGLNRILPGSRSEITADQAWGQVKNGIEENKIEDKTLLAGVDEKKVLGLFTKKEPVEVKAREYTVSYVHGRTIMWQMMTDEYNNIYLPAKLYSGRQEKVRDIVDYALAEAQKEDASFHHGGVVNRLPAAVEEKVNPAHFAILKLRRDAVSSCPPVPGLAAQLGKNTTLPRQENFIASKKI